MKEMQKLLSPLGQSVQSMLMLMFLPAALLPTWGFARPVSFPKPLHNPAILVNEEVTISALTEPGQFVDFPSRMAQLFTQAPS